MVFVNFSQQIFLRLFNISLIRSVFTGTSEIKTRSPDFLVIGIKLDVTCL